MKIIISTILFAALLIACLGNSSNKGYVKAHADTTLQANGWQQVGYEGYQFSTGFPFTPYGGACVWYKFRAVPDTGINYTGCLKRWGDEVHLYNVSAYDAIRPRN